MKYRIGFAEHLKSRESAYGGLPMRIAVIDIGTNSTRLLVADVTEGGVEELERRTEITRLGEGVDRDGHLQDEAIERVLSTCARYREIADRLSPARPVAVLTSAVRDADNGPELERALRERFGFDARTITGDDEARLTYLGATFGRRHAEPLLVIDIGGGSTEFVVGRGDVVDFYISTQIGSVRHTERLLRSDPPTAEEMERCSREIRSGIEGAIPPAIRAAVAEGIAVAGTPTSFAAVDLELEPYDRERVDGYRLSRSVAEAILARLARMPLEERRKVKGLHPERAPTIVAGGVILVEGMRGFELDSILVSEHDILEGAALEAARANGG